MKHARAVLRPVLAPPLTGQVQPAEKISGRTGVDATFFLMGHG